MILCCDSMIVIQEAGNNVALQLLSLSNSNVSITFKQIYQ